MAGYRGPKRPYPRDWGSPLQGHGHPSRKQGRCDNYPPDPYGVPMRDDFHSPEPYMDPMRDDFYSPDPYSDGGVGDYYGGDPYRGGRGDDYGDYSYRDQQPYTNNPFDGYESGYSQCRDQRGIPQRGGRGNNGGQHGRQQRGGDFQQRDGNFQPRDGNFQQRGGNFQQRGGNFQQGGGNFQQRGGNFQQGGGNFQQGGGNFQQRGGNYQQRGGNFQQEGGNFQQRSGQFNRGGGSIGGQFHPEGQLQRGGGQFQQGGSPFQRGQFQQDRSRFQQGGVGGQAEPINPLNVLAGMITLSKMMSGGGAQQNSGGPINQFGRGMGLSGRGNGQFGRGMGQPGRGNGQFGRGKGQPGPGMGQSGGGKGQPGPGMGQSGGGKGQFGGEKGQPGLSLTSGASKRRKSRKKWELPLLLDLANMTVAEKLHRLFLFIRRGEHVGENSIITLNTAVIKTNLGIKEDYQAEEIMKIKGYGKHVFSGVLKLDNVFIARCVAFNKKELKNEVYDKALEFMRTKTVGDIYNMKDVGKNSLIEQLHEHFKKNGRSDLNLNVETETQLDNMNRGVNFNVTDALQSCMDSLKRLDPRPNSPFTAIEIAMKKAKCSLRYNYESDVVKLPWGHPYFLGKIMFTDIVIGRGKGMTRKSCRLDTFMKTMDRLLNKSIQDLLISVPEQPKPILNRDARSIQETRPLEERLTDFVQSLVTTTHRDSNINTFDLSAMLLGLKPSLVYRSLPKTDEEEPDMIQCDLYLENIHLGTSTGARRKELMLKAYNEAWELLTTNPLEKVLKERKRATDMEFKEMDVVDVVVKGGYGKSTESNAQGLKRFGWNLNKLANHKFDELVLIEHNEWAETRAKNAFSLLQYSCIQNGLILKWTCEVVDSKVYKDINSKCCMYIQRHLVGMSYGKNKFEAKHSAAKDALFSLYETCPTLQIADRRFDHRSWIPWGAIEKEANELRSKAKEQESDGETNKQETNAETDKQEKGTNEQDTEIDKQDMESDNQVDTDNKADADKQETETDKEETETDKKEADTDKQETETDKQESTVETDKKRNIVKTNELETNDKEEKVYTSEDQHEMILPDPFIMKVLKAKLKAAAEKKEELIIGPGIGPDELREVKHLAKTFDMKLDTRHSVGFHDQYLVFYVKLGWWPMANVLRQRKGPYGKFKLASEDEVPKYADIEDQVIKDITKYKIDPEDTDNQGNQEESLSQGGENECEDKEDTTKAEDQGNASEATIDLT